MNQPPPDAMPETISKTMPKAIPKPPKHASPASLVAYWLSVGLGSGLAPKAPGTFGSLAALVFAPLWVTLGFWASAAVIALASIAGIWICGRAAKDMGIHDSGHIVWDEFAGQWLALLPLIYLQKTTWLGVLVAFILFRVFDILKPWPIRQIDKKVTGGLGIMLDDIIAGVVAAAWLYVLIRFQMI